MTGVLLDTHALLWWLGDDARLSAVAREIVADPRRTVLVSAASLWEIAIKRSLSKLEAPDDLPRIVVDQGFAVLAISAEHAWAVRALPRHHGDPFDRLLVAQSVVEGLTVVSADAQLDAYGVARHW